MLKGGGGGGGVGGGGGGGCSVFEESISDTDTMNYRAMFHFDIQG